MRYLSLLTIVFLLHGTVTAQRSVPYKLFTVVSPDLLVPTGDLSESHRNGVGASLTIGYKMSRSFAPVASYHFYSIPGKDGFANLRASLVKAGGRLYLGNFYLLADAGAINTSGFDNDTRFVYGLGAGDDIRLGKRSKLEVSATYESFTTPAQTNGVFAVRVGYLYYIGR